MYDDSMNAIEIDDTNYKAFIKNGEACIELGKSPHRKDTEFIEKGLRRLQRSITILDHIIPSDPIYANRKKLQAQVEKQILRGKKIKWYKEIEIQEIKTIELINKIK